MKKTSRRVRQIKRKGDYITDKALRRLNFKFVQFIKASALGLVLLGTSGPVQRAAFLGSEAVSAQVTPDNTTNTQVNTGPLTGPPIDGNIITGGTDQGSSLFHSFSSFSPGTTATEFLVAPNITNIFSRVTGSSISDLNGFLQVVGGDTPNLFLLNPNGILMGPQAAINVPGSLVFSTADRILFDDTGSVFFSASDTAGSMLTISTPVGLQFGRSAQAITANGRFTGRREDGSFDSDEALALSPATSLTLLGGDINLNNVYFNLPKRRITIGSVAPETVVGLSTQTGTIVPDDRNPGNTLPTTTHLLDYAPETVFQDVQIQDSTLRVSGVSSGTIQIQGRQVSVTGTQVRSQNEGSEDGGSIEIIGSERILLDDSRVTSDLEKTQVGPRSFLTSTGNGGSVSIIAPQVILDDIFVSSLTTSEGDGGNITIGSREANPSDYVEIRNESLVQSSVQPDTIGLSIDEIESVATLPPMTIERTVGTIDQVIGRPNGTAAQVGNFLVAFGLPTPEVIAIFGEVTAITNSTELTPQGIAASVSQFDTLLDNTSLPANQKGIVLQNLSIGFSGLQFESEQAQALLTHAALDPSQLTMAIAQIESVAIIPAAGQGGDVTINTGRLLVEGTSQVGAGTFGEGDSGDVSITTSHSVEITGAELVSEFVEDEQKTHNPSGLFTVAVRRATGNGGNLTITTPQLSVNDGAQISANTSARGNAGNIIIRTDTLSVSDPVIDPNGIVSGIIATVSSAGSGEGGLIDIESDRVHVFNGGQIAASTFGQGNASNINIQSQSIEIEGSSADGRFDSSVSSSSATPFDAGSVNVSSDRINIRDNGNISVSSVNGGNAGNVNLLTNRLTLNNGSIEAEADAGNQGNLNIASRDVLLLRNGSKITTNAIGAATGGNITLNAPIVIGTDNSDISANAIEGNGGNIRLVTEGLIGLEFRDQLTPDSDITASSELGVNGTVEIESPNVDTDSGLVQLPENLADASDQIANSCAAGDGNRFASTGRGGLPANPLEHISSNRPWQDIRVQSPRNVSPGQSTGQSIATANTENDSGNMIVEEKTADSVSVAINPSQASNVEELVEASRWQVNEAGQVQLVDESELAHSPSRCLEQVVATS